MKSFTSNIIWKRERLPSTIADATTRRNGHGVAVTIRCHPSPATGKRLISDDVGVVGADVATDTATGATLVSPLEDDDDDVAAADDGLVVLEPEVEVGVAGTEHCEIQPRLIDDLSPTCTLTNRTPALATAANDVDGINNGQPSDSDNGGGGGVLDDLLLPISRFDEIILCTT
jgi:hypothetical protein